MKYLEMLPLTFLHRLGRPLGKDKIFEVIENVIKKSDIARKTTFHVTMTYFWIQVMEGGSRCLSERLMSGHGIRLII